MNLYPVVGVIHGYIGDAPTLLKVEELACIALSCHKPTR